MSLLEVCSLRVRFAARNGAVEPVDSVSFELERGEVLGIVGESGSGKSLTAHAIMRLLHLSGGTVAGGTIRFRGEDLQQKSETEMRMIRGQGMGFIPQNPMTSLDPVYTVGRQIVEGIVCHSKMSHATARTRAIETMRQVQIPGAMHVFNQYPHQLSGGLRQRVVIAMSLALSPKLIIADEPTTALDVTIQQQILHLMRGTARDHNVGIVLITHDLGAVAEICDRVAVMYAGRVVEIGTVSDVLARPKHPYTLALLDCVPRLGMRRRSLRPIPGSVPSVTNLPTGCRFHPRCADAREACRQVEPETVVVDATSTVACVKYMSGDVVCP